MAVREGVDCPGPGGMAPARHRLRSHELVWEQVYLRIGTAIGAAATDLNRLQFLTIRRYLSLVMISLVGLLLVLTIWNCSAGFSFRGRR